MIVGVTGYYAAGKDTIAEMLVRNGFVHFSLSHFIDKDLEKKGKPPTRENQIAHANWMRQTFGNNVLAARALAEVHDDRNVVFTSIRNPSEVELFKSRKDFVLVNVSAPIEMRFRRIQLRARVGDPKSLEELQEKEAIESSSDPSKQQLHTVTKMARVVIVNDTTIARLQEKVTKFCKDWAPQLLPPKPNWDEYFLTIAKTVSSRSSCIKRKVGAVVCRDLKIITAGYNGTPRGVKNCNEGGCNRCNSFGESGAALDECRCSHGEENAIVQASFHGQSVKEGTLYTTYSPCMTCAKMIVNAGIKEVVYNAEYPLADNAAKLLKEAKIKVRQHRV